MLRRAAFGAALSAAACQLLFSFAGAEIAHRIAFGSCANPNHGGQIYELIESFHPQHLVLLGDNIYVDHQKIGTIAENFTAIMQHEYKVLEQLPAWQSLLHSVDTWSATYDDHDYGVNNADKTFPHRKFAQQAFWEFARDSFEQGSDPTSQDAVYSAKTVRVPSILPNGDDFVYKLLMLDARSNKDTSGTQGGDFLGSEQWRWLAQELSDPAPQLVLVGSGIQVLTDDKLLEESWSEFPFARERLLRYLTAASATADVVMLSGDIHRAEANHASCRLESIEAVTGGAGAGGDFDDLLGAAAVLWEFTSSGLTHTLKQVLDRRPQGQQSSDSKAVPVRSRGVLFEIVDSIYQFAYPAFYRVDKCADHYSELHFGLLDLVPALSSDRSSDSSGNATVQSHGLSLDFSIISHRGERVISRSLPLGDFSDSSRVRNLAFLEYAQSDAVLLRCEPARGPLTLWRALMFRAIIAAALMLLLVLPALMVLWFLAASIYYVAMGAEYTRRERIEAQFQEHKKVL
ncbi:hypothetical protein B484DRAFT_403320 [Ochromonadaceae sp. CCMP2298]|nr:hypothetical protein B484DRAFT_403320 [Ochromonadaceae sp. CCMP2298]